MRSTIALVIVAAACLGASGCIAVVKDGGGSSEPRSKPAPTSTASTQERGIVEPIAALDRKVDGDHEWVSTDVRYVNDTSRTLKSVTIWCRALDAGGYELASQHVTLVSGDVGPMAPGFKAKRSVSFAQPTGAVAAVACEVTSAQ